MLSFILGLFLIVLKDVLFCGHPRMSYVEMTDVLQECLSVGKIFINVNKYLFRP